MYVLFQNYKKWTANNANIINLYFSKIHKPPLQNCATPKFRSAEIFYVIGTKLF